MAVVAACGDLDPVVMIDESLALSRQYLLPSDCWTLQIALALVGHATRHQDLGAVEEEQPLKGTYSYPQPHSDGLDRLLAPLLVELRESFRS